MTIKGELLALKKHGLIKPHVVYMWAKSHPGSDTYKALEWDDAKAGYEHRLNQIRHLIVLHIRDATGAPEVVNLTIDRTNRDGGGYRLIDEVAEEPRLQKILLQDAINDLKRAREKYRGVKELAALWEAFDDVIGAFEVAERKGGKVQRAKQAKQAKHGPAERSPA